MIRKAKLQEIPEIYRLLAECSGQWNVLPRSLAELYSFVRDYFVYREDGHEAILGVAALHVFWENLGEIRSVIVAPDHQGRGIGSQLVAGCLAEARTLGLEQIFVLTDCLDFFRRFGFQEFPREKLHPRIWADCVKCVKFPDCDEVPMVLELTDTP
jgi:amino-acid N-acetyltransferase|uniref:N-acetyltransferase n=1 Tax=Desulfobacca acetoxidans TaxID=60893 RepID=A0A7V6A1C7_9BACT